MTFGEKVIEFNKNLKLETRLPEGIRVMNPFTEHEGAFEVSSSFYQKFYNDQNERRIILGINPGRFGAGVTGIPFTDTKRLEGACGLKMKGDTQTHEPSSVFVYEMIEAFGGVEAFYSRFYINSVCPLGFVRLNKKGREVNYNYYDRKDLTSAVYAFIIASLKAQLALGIDTRIVWSMGSNKNFKFLSKLNEEYQLFERIIPLEHPRFVVQYKSKDKRFYINKYLESLQQA
jgi:hypothetical protein